MSPVFHIALVTVGATIVVLTVFSAVGTFVVPRGVAARLPRVVFVVMRELLDVRLRFVRGGQIRREQVLAWYAPLSLVVLVGTWLVLVVAGFTFVFRGLGVREWRAAFGAAGSSLTTLGFVPLDGVLRQAAAFADAALGLLLLALLITYLPTIYASFQRREAIVARAAMQAGSPPTGVELLQRFQRIAGFEALEQQVWHPWTSGFVDIEESHTSMASLAFFRSPRPDRNWVTAAGAVLDAASLRVSTVDAPRQASAELCIRAGYLALRHIADFYGIPYDPEPRRGDPISVTRDEWDAARARLAEAGVPLRPDVEEAWLDFMGWRVNYDAVLLMVANLVMAPPAPWTSDRGPSHRFTPPMVRRRSRSRAGA